MNKIIIADIDKKLNKKHKSYDTAIVRIQEYIVLNIDDTFPCDLFETWYNSDDNKPFRWNKVIYYWD